MKNFLLFTAFILAVFIRANANAQPALRVVAHDGLKISYADTGDASQLNLVFAIWKNAKQQLTEFGLAVPDAELVAVANANDFLNRTGQGATVAAITTGNRITSQRLAALAAQKLLRFTIRHEAFHLAQPKNMPRWLAEGLARIFSGEHVSASNTATGLAWVTEKELDMLLRSPDTTKRSFAYREASRRAQELLRRMGWRALLARYK